MLTGDEMKLRGVECLSLGPTDAGLPSRSLDPDLCAPDVRWSSLVGGIPSVPALMNGQAPTATCGKWAAVLGSLSRISCGVFNTSEPKAPLETPSQCLPGVSGLSEHGGGRPDGAQVVGGLSLCVAGAKAWRGEGQGGRGLIM